MTGRSLSPSPARVVRLFAAAGVALLAMGLFASPSERAKAADDAPSSALVDSPIDPSTGAEFSQRAPAAPRRPVCVRLCDGYFFPAPADSGRESACSELCPGARTALFFLPAGSDRIEEATSAAGDRYSTLPASLRYRRERVAGCACARGAPGRDYWRDPTLRRGDAVMTERGLAVYGGAIPSPSGFADLASAPISERRRAALQAIEQASTPAADDFDRAEIAAGELRPAARTRGGAEFRFLAAPVAAPGDEDAARERLTSP